MSFKRGLSTEIDDLLGRELKGKLNESLLLIILTKNYTAFLKDKDTKVTGFRGRSQKVTEGLTTRELADELKMPQSTIATAVGRLVKKRLLTHSKGLPVITTEEGRSLGNERLRHHRLLEILLYECAGLDIEASHTEAIKLMLLTSCELTAAIDQKFNNPQLCPCGEEIPQDVDRCVS